MPGFTHQLCFCFASNFKQAAREACCTQTKGDDLTKSNMCERLKCVWNKCQTEPGWGGDTHPPTNEPTTEPTPKPTRNPTPKPTTRSPTKSPNWGADGYDGDANDNDDWAGDGECTKDEQDRCCSQHETKSLELQAKICKNKFGCTIFKCPQYRTGADGSYAENYDGLDWNDDGHLDDTCTQDEQDKCCEQHDGVSITRQQQICKNMWNCSLLKCPKHRQSYKPKLPTLRPTYRPYASISDSNNYPVNGYPVKEDDGYPVNDNGGYSEEDTCSDTDKKSCCNQNPLKPFGVQYSFCTKLGCNLHMCTKYTNGAWKNDAWYEEDAEKCTEEEHFNCCTQPSTIGIGVQHQNCLKTGCSLFNCDEDDDGDEDYRQKIKWGNTEVKFGYGGDDSTCPDEHKWQCCSPNRSISGSYKSIVKNCQVRFATTQDSTFVSANKQLTLIFIYLLLNNRTSDVIGTCVLRIEILSFKILKSIMTPTMSMETGTMMINVPMRASGAAAIQTQLSEV